MQKLVISFVSFVNIRKEENLADFSRIVLTHNFYKIFILALDNTSNNNVNIEYLCFALPLSLCNMEKKKSC